MNIAVDAESYAYVVGFFTETTRFGSTVLTSQDQSDLFVAKLSPAGHWDWAVGAGSVESDRAAGVAVDAAGRVFVTGTFGQQVS